MKSLLRVALVALCAAGAVILSEPAAAQKSESPTTVVHFNQDIRPILSNHCFKCHGPDLKKGGLDLQNNAAALKKLKSGNVAFVPGKAKESRLLEVVSAAADAPGHMPPQGDRLTSKQIALLQAWLDQGAKYEEHWAYVQPVHHPLPTVRDKQWPRNGIDAFVLARLDAEGLTPSSEANKSVLLRRVCFDLTGLPPTLAQLDEFLQDQSPDAYERLVERLLASPHYGEHQARFWLDLARYADTNGYEKDDRRTIWPYRDWVIDAFNRDLPFDQFTIEQLAGDLLPNATQSQKIATGFHRNTMVNTEGGTDDEEFRVAALIDRVNTTMSVWMGTTIACAQCHNHKYDPFTQKEFYQLYAFFNGTADRGRDNGPTLSIPTAKEQEQQRHLKAAVAALQKLPNGIYFVGGPAAKRALQAHSAALQKQEAALKPTATMVMQELPKPRETKVMLRGNFKNLGDTVTAAVPAKLNPWPAEAPLNRLGLARWLVAADNPLVGRVTINRIWARYFGHGFVETSEEFGTQGDLPTHPELLDWLATEWLERKWSLKSLHKLIVLSATYRQSAKVSPELYKRDPYNRLLARGPRFRLDAEMVRDNALAISGLLSRKIGGPSVFPYQPDGVWSNPYSGDRWVVSSEGDQHRRGLYTFWRRTAPYAAFMAFDAPSREICTERRPRTNTPLQALATLNDKVFVEASGALARRLMTESKGDEQARLNLGFRLCVARTPTEQETAMLLKLYRENLEKFQLDGVAAQALAKGGLAIAPKELNAAELAAWTIVANVLLNLDETITKG